MTAFTGEPRPFQLLVEVPAARIQAAGIDEVPSRHGTRDGPKRSCRSVNERCESPVETDHDPVVAGSFDGVQDLGELLLGEGERLLDEDREAALEGLAHQAACEWCRVTMNTASRVSSSSTVSTLVVIVRTRTCVAR